MGSNGKKTAGFTVQESNLMENLCNKKSGITPDFYIYVRIVDIYSTFLSASANGTFLTFLVWKNAITVYEIMPIIAIFTNTDGAA